MNKKLWFISVLLIVFMVTSNVSAAQSSQFPLAGGAIPQFAQPLPVLALPGTGGTMAVADGTVPVTLRMCEFWANVLPPGTFAAGVQPKTRVWGYIQGEACPPNGPDDPAVDTYIGPIVLATRGTPTQFTFLNELGWADTTQVLAYKYSIDQTLHWADPEYGEENECSHTGGVPDPGTECAENYDGPIPAAVHLHGGEVPPELDGGPDSWVTSDGAFKGHGYYTQYPGVDPENGATYTYPNTQEAAPIWFHDHTLGATRLNVYAGLAGGYLIQDPDLVLPNGLHPYGLVNNSVFEPTVPVVIQDRMFDTNGQLFFPAASAGGVLAALNPEHPYWNPEFVGDTVVVNGKAWPYFNVEPKRYRFLFLNGSNARTYEMFLIDPVTKAMGPSMVVIGTDGGYLDNPVKIDPNAPKGQLQRLVMMPGERYEVIIDFSTVKPGTNLILRNIAKTPFPAGATPDGNTIGRVMQFRVGACTGSCGAQDTSYNPAAGTAIRTGDQMIQRLVDPASGTLKPGVTVAKSRQLTLNEVMGMGRTEIDPVTGASLAFPGGPLEVLVNNTKFDGGVDHMGTGECSRGDFTQISVGGATTCISEIPQEGDTEVWEIVNLTADAHPIHLHLVQFQILNRQGFNTNKYNAAYNAAFPGGGIDPMTGMPYPAGTYVPAYGPPLSYDPAGNALSGGKYGGNPNVDPYLQGRILPPAANEAGWKDTVIVYPGQVTRIAVRWAPTDLPVGSPASALYFPFDPSGQGEFGYVWHCHIIDHEDNEMMRPDMVTLNPAAPSPDLRDFVKGVKY